MTSRTNLAIEIDNNYFYINLNSIFITSYLTDNGINIVINLTAEDLNDIKYIGTSMDNTFVSYEASFEISKCHAGKEAQEKNCAKEDSYTMDNFAEELLNCTDGMPVYHVSQSFI